MISSTSPQFKDFRSWDANHFRRKILFGFECEVRLFL